MAPHCSVRRLMCGAFAIWLAFFSVLPTSVLAHSSLEITSPPDGSVVTAPSTISLEFNEDVSNARVVVRNSAKKLVETRVLKRTTTNIILIAPKARLIPGAYKVSWRVRSSDGHYISGAFSFTVKKKLTKVVQKTPHR